MSFGRAVVVRALTPARSSRDCCPDCKMSVMGCCASCRWERRALAAVSAMHDERFRPSTSPEWQLKKRSRGNAAAPTPAPSRLRSRLADAKAADTTLSDRKPPWPPVPQEIKRRIPDPELMSPRRGTRPGASGVRDYFQFQSKIEDTHFCGLCLPHSCHGRTAGYGPTEGGGRCRCAHGDWCFSD